MTLHHIAVITAQAAEEGGGTEIDLGIIGLAVVAVVAVVLLLRRRR